MQRAPIAPPVRLLVYSHDLPSLSSIAEALARRGIEVRAVSDFQELCAWLVCWRGTAAALVEMPGLDTFRETVMGALHRIDPGLAVAPLDRPHTVEQTVQDVMPLLAAAHLPDDGQDELSSREAA